MADRPKRPPTGSNDEPFRVTRPRIAPPPPLPPRPHRGGLDEKKAEMLRAYVNGEEIPASDVPPSSDPEPSFQSSARDDVDASVPPRRSPRRMVHLPDDMTIRPRRSLHQKIKDWSETFSHAQKIVVAVFTIGTAAGPLLYQWTIKPVVTWVRTRASIEESKKACFDLLADAGKADEIAVGALRAEVGDAGVLQGANWDKQDEINAYVSKELSRLRLQTPPKPIGPKATGKR
jgi:hypothetical protein